MNKFLATTGMFAFTLLYFPSCSSNSQDLEALQIELQTLRSRVEKDSLLRAELEGQFSSIEADMQAIAEFTKTTAKGQRSRLDFEQGLAHIDKEIRENTGRLEALGTVLQENQEEFSDYELQAYKGKLEQNKSQLQSYQTELDELRPAIAKLQGENDKLKSFQFSLQEAYDARGDELLSVRQQVQKAQMRLAELEKAIKNSEAQAQKLQQQILQEYVRIAQELVTIAHDAKGLLGSAKATKEDCAGRAFDYLCKAHKLGHYNALSYLQDLRTDAKLKKFLKGKDCS